MTGWNDLRRDLRRLRDESPDALRGFPDPDSDRAEGERICVELAAWATDVAAVLHGKYGTWLDLRVGAMSFPTREQVRGAARLSGAPTDSVGLVIETAEELRVRTGRNLRAPVLVTNRGEEPRVLHTNGVLQSAVVDSAGEVVGCYAGAQIMPLVRFIVEPGESSRVPALIGTASVVPDLGYAVPPGTWGVVIRVPTRDADLLSVPLPLTITS